MYRKEKEDHQETKDLLRTEIEARKEAEVKLGNVLDTIDTLNNVEILSDNLKVYGKWTKEGIMNYPASIFREKEKLIQLCQTRLNTAHPLFQRMGILN